MEKEERDRINVRTALVSLALGWILTISAFVIDPAGQVHDSVLWILGQSLTFAGSLLGAKSYIDYKTSTRHDTHTYTHV